MRTTEKVRYQGKEYEITLQAPTEKALNEMIGYSQSMAKRFDMDTIKVLEKGPDPDGGYRAIVIAHNFNPFRWLKRKIEKKGKSSSEKIRLERYYRREDAARKAVKHPKQRARHGERLEHAQYQASLAEQKARKEKAKAQKRAYRGASRLGSRFAYTDTNLTRRQPVISSRMRPISSKTRRLR